MRTLPAQTTDDLTVARAARVATSRVRGVVAINRGRDALARTYGLGGAVVEGVQLRHAADGLHVEIHVVAALVPLLALAATVRAAVAATLAAMDTRVAAVDVCIDDLWLGDGAREETSA